MYVRIHACIHIWSRAHDCTCAWARCYAPHARRRAPPSAAALKLHTFVMEVRTDGMLLADVGVVLIFGALQVMGFLSFESPVSHRDGSEFERQVRQRFSDDLQRGSPQWRVRVDDCDQVFIFDGASVIPLSQEHYDHVVVKTRATRVSQTAR